MIAADGDMNIRLCIVTGGSGAIGSSTSKMLRQRGNDLIVLRRDQRRGRAAVDDVDFWNAKGSRWTNEAAPSFVFLPSTRKKLR